MLPRSTLGGDLLTCLGKVLLWNLLLQLSLRTLLTILLQLLTLVGYVLSMLRKLLVGSCTSLLLGMKLLTSHILRLLHRGNLLMINDSGGSLLLNSRLLAGDTRLSCALVLRDGASSQSAVRGAWDAGDLPARRTVTAARDDADNLGRPFVSQKLC